MMPVTKERIAGVAGKDFRVLVVEWECGPWGALNSNGHLPGPVSPGLKFGTGKTTSPRLLSLAPLLASHALVLSVPTRLTDPLSRTQNREFVYWSRRRNPPRPVALNVSESLCYGSKSFSEPFPEALPLPFTCQPQVLPKDGSSLRNNRSRGE